MALGALCLATGLCGIGLLAFRRHDRAWRFLIGLAIACTAYALSNLSNPLKQPIAADIVPAGGLGAEPA